MSSMVRGDTPGLYLRRDVLEVTQRNRNTMTAKATITLTTSPIEFQVEENQAFRYFGETLKVKKDMLRMKAVIVRQVIYGFGGLLGISRVALSVLQVRSRTYAQYKFRSANISIFRTMSKSRTGIQLSKKQKKSFALPRNANGDAYSVPSPSNVAICQWVYKTIGYNLGRTIVETIRYI